MDQKIIKIIGTQGEALSLMSSTYEDLQAQAVAEIRKLQDALRATTQQYEDAIADMDGEKLDLKDKIKDLEKKLANCNQLEVSNLKNHLHHIHNEAARWKKQHEKLEAKYDDAFEKLKTARAENERICLDIMDLKREVPALKGSVSERDRQIVALREERDKQAEEIRLMKLNIGSLAVENDRMRGSQQVPSPTLRETVEAECIDHEDRVPQEGSLCSACEHVLGDDVCTHCGNNPQQQPDPEEDPKTADGKDFKKGEYWYHKPGNPIGQAVLGKIFSVHAEGVWFTSPHGGDIDIPYEEAATHIWESEGRMFESQMDDRPVFADGVVIAIEGMCYCPKYPAWEKVKVYNYRTPEQLVLVNPDGGALIGYGFLEECWSTKESWERSKK